MCARWLGDSLLIALLAALFSALVLSACSVPGLAAPTNTPSPVPSDTPTATLTPRPTVTPTITLTPTPSSTATMTPTPSDTPTATPTPTIFALVRARQRVNVRSGPGTGFAAIDSLAPGEGAPVIQRNEDGAWLQLRLDADDDEAVGWVSAALLQVDTPPPPIPPEPTADYRMLLELPIVDLDSAQGTATAIAQSALATAPAATPAEAARAPDRPAAAPRHDVPVFAFCDGRSYGIPPPVGLTSGSTIQLFWAWFASSEAQVWQHINSADHDLRVNGQPIADVDAFRQTPRRDDSQYVVYWYVPYGPLTAGDYEISYRVTWRQAINDGSARYGPGTNTESESESCNFRVR